MVRLTRLVFSLFAAITPGLGLAGVDAVAPEDAFLITAHRTDHANVKVTINALDGYALYRSKLMLQGIGVAIVAVDGPEGRLIDDVSLGQQRVFDGNVVLNVSAPFESQGEEIRLFLLGCKLGAFCFNPWQIKVPIGR